MELECHAYNSDTQVYTMSGAGGNITEGQMADIFGNGGDVAVKKTNGETVEVQLHCAGGKYGYDHVQAVINVER